MHRVLREVFLLLAVCVLMINAPATALGTPTAQSGTTVVYLVRHAEPTPPPYAESPPDPPLNAAGLARAEALAEALAAEPLNTIFSTDFNRTRQTAAPVAARAGLQVEIYDPWALEEFAARLASTPGRHVVVGHSNTTPELVQLLGGDPGDPIDEEREFDRLYVVVLRANGEVTTMQLRYGAPSER